MRFGKDRSFLVHDEVPFNGGPPPELLARQAVTPVELFFVRNHAPVPQVDPAGWRLSVGGLVRQPLELDLHALAGRFPRRELTAALQCAGNRRRELIQVRPINGELPWGSEALGNARWSGVALADVLAAAGVREGAAHVAFEGLDTVERDAEEFRFGGSVPLAKALAAETLLADGMNGAPLTPVHGFPLRVVVPGYIGARSVKWLARITVLAEPSSNYFQQRAYRLRASGDDPGVMLGETGVQSLLLTPTASARPRAGIVRVEGVALGAAGQPVVRVELSTDGGRAWSRARLIDPPAPWAWTRFDAEVPAKAGTLEIVARAHDAGGATQPESPDGLWNVKGYVNNAWPRLRLSIRPRRTSVMSAPPNAP